MKYRQDFVTNSSSSSYTCLLTGETFSGQDAMPGDFGLCQCEKEHVFDEGFRVKPTIKEKSEYLVEWLKHDESLKEDWRCADKEFIAQLEKIREGKASDEEIEEAWEKHGEDEYEVTKIECPICRFAYPEPSLLLQFLVKKYEINVINELKALKAEFEDAGEAEYKLGTFDPKEYKNE